MFEPVLCSSAHICRNIAKPLRILFQATLELVVCTDISASVCTADRTLITTCKISVVDPTAGKISPDKNCNIFMITKWKLLIRGNKLLLTFCVMLDLETVHSTQCWPDCTECAGASQTVHVAGKSLPSARLHICTHCLTAGHTASLHLDKAGHCRSQLDDDDQAGL